MAPQSDVDLLFLIADKKGSSYTEQITQYMLYMLITQYMLYMLQRGPSINVLSSPKKTKPFSHRY